MSAKKVLYILVPQWADFEWGHIGAALHYFNGLFENVRVGLSKEPVTSKGGLTVIPDTDIKGAREMEFDTLVLIGGDSWQQIDSPELADFVRETYASGKTVAAICSAATYLGRIGLLNSAAHTVNDLDELKKLAGDNYTNESGYKAVQCVTDGNLITANGSASIEFARDIMLTMKEIPADGTMWWYRFNKFGQFSEQEEA